MKVSFVPRLLVAVCSLKTLDSSDVHVELVTEVSCISTHCWDRYNLQLLRHNSEWMKFDFHVKWNNDYCCFVYDTTKTNIAAHEAQQQWSVCQVVINPRQFVLTTNLAVNCGYALYTPHCNPISWNVGQNLTRREFYFKCNKLLSGRSHLIRRW